MKNNIIPPEVAERFTIFELCDFQIPEDSPIGLQKNFYKDFLRKTDYIPAKLMEPQLAGETLDEDYTAILGYRKLAREEINRLQENLE